MQNVSSTRPYLGAILGRVSNRVKNAQFMLNGETYHLTKNDGNNTLHGGLRGFDNVLLKVNEYRGGRRPSVKFTYHSFDGEQGESRCDLALNLLTTTSMGKKVI